MFIRDPGIVPLFIASFTLFLAACGLPEAPAPRDPPLRTYFLDVGQGDACLIRSPAGRDYLFDIGNRESLLAVALEELDVDTLDAVLISHPDLDHFGAFPALESFPVKRWYLPETMSPDPAWSRLIGELDAAHAQLDTLYQGDTLVWPGGIQAKVLWPPPHFSGSDNDLSLVLKVRFQGSALLLTGDVEAEAEAGLVGSGLDLSADILKVAHHGSRTSSALPFLAEVAARWAVISCDSTVYGHPHPETLAGLRHFLPGEGRILRTDVEGTVGFEMDTEGIRRIGKK